MLIFIVEGNFIMKYLICSDIHGSIDSTNKLIEVYKENNCDYILLLGDVLYHGPRNDLPKGYEPKKVIQALNPLSERILCVKGNCEAEVDQMVLNFKIHDFLDLDINGLKAHLEHGHHLDEYNGDAEIILSGHTHIPVLEKINNVIFLNPGSTTIPKNNSNRGYAIWDNTDISLLDFDGNLITSLKY